MAERFIWSLIHSQFKLGRHGSILFFSHIYFLVGSSYEKHQNTGSWHLNISSTPIVWMPSNFTTDKIEGWDDQKKKFRAHLSSLWQKYDHLKMRKNDMKFVYKKGTLRETIKLVGSSIDRMVYIQRSRKTMLRISYAHIVSHYHVIWVIRPLFCSF